MAEAVKPLVSIGLPVWNGELFLAETLTSLVNQTYKNIEIIILDNQSTDNTRQICEKFSTDDLRVKYILDDQKRDVIQGHNKVAELAKGEFFMVMCDDDVYHKEYINTLLQILLTDPQVGLAYSNWNWIYPDGALKSAKWKWFINKQDSKFKNFRKYSFKRYPIPFCFGVIRMDVHRDALKYYYRPDHRGWNHDNLYMFSLLSKTKVESSKEVLFFYRERDRNALYIQRGQQLKLGSGIKKFREHVLHQISFQREIFKILNNSSYNYFEKTVLKLETLLAFMHFAFFSQIFVPLYYWMLSLYRKSNPKII